SGAPAWRSLVPIVLWPLSPGDLGLPPAGLGGALPVPKLAGLPPYSPFPSEYLAPEPGAPAPNVPPRATGQRHPQVKDVPDTGHPSRLLSGGGLPFSSPRGGPLASLSSKLPPPTILSTVPQQMFSDAGEGSGEDPLDGDDELVIDIPE
ncbi:unnamed protein product, partial [Natator depressus]